MIVNRPKWPCEVLDNLLPHKAPKAVSQLDARIPIL